MSGNQKISKAKQKNVNAKAFHDLQQAEAKYRSTIENAAEGIYLSTPGGRYLSVNQAMARIYGSDAPEEMIAAVTDIAQQVCADPEMRGEFARRLKKEGKVEKLELRALRKDGSLIWTSTNARIVRDAKGKVLFYEGFVQDITERKRTEEEITSLAKFPPENPNPVLRIDQEDILLYANQAAFLLLADWNLQIGQAVPEVLRELMRGTFVDQRVQIADIPCGERIFSVTASPITEASYINLYIQDVTARKRAEETLERSVAKYRSLVETGGAGVASTDTEGKFTFVNGTLCQMLGYSAEELIGQPFISFLHPRRGRNIESILERR